VQNSDYLPIQNSLLTINSFLTSSTAEMKAFADESLDRETQSAGKMLTLDAARQPAAKPVKGYKNLLSRSGNACALQVSRSEKVSV